MLRKKDAPSDDTVAASVAVPAAKKDLPPAVLAGVAVGLLALLGIAAYFMFFRAPAPIKTAPMPPRTMAGMSGANGVGGPGNAPGMPPRGGMPGTAAGMPNAASGMPGMPGAGRAVSPDAGAPGSMMPDGAMSRPTTAAGAAPPVPVISAAPVRPGPGAPPTLAPQSASVRALATPLTPTLQAQLNILWQRGADAKHRGDYNAARGYWRQALRLRPGHPGFAEAIRKLPPQQGRRVR